MLSSQLTKLIWAGVPLLISAWLFRRKRAVKRDPAQFDPLKAAFVSGAVMGGLLFLMFSTPFWGRIPWEFRRVWWSWVGAFPNNYIIVLVSFVFGIFIGRLGNGCVHYWRWTIIAPLIFWAQFSTPQAPFLVMHQNRPIRWKDGVCLQSTGFTCAPAAAATFLNIYGFQTDESEMASRCKTESYGTYMNNLAAGLNQMLPEDEFTIRFCRVTPWELKNINIPCITSHTTSTGYHAWVVFDFQGNGRIEMGEGGSGRHWMTYDWFSETFTGRVVLVTKKDKVTNSVREKLRNLDDVGLTVERYGYDGSD